MRKIIITIDDDGRFVDIMTEEVKVKDEEVEETEEVIEMDKTKDITDYSIYARIWDDGYIGRRTKNPEYNLTFLKMQQNYANEILKTRGYIFLNEVYDLLGIPNTEAGAIVGWIYNEEDPIGDNFVDFGIFDVTSIQNRDFINGYARTVVLDFNVDGNIKKILDQE